MARYTYSLKVAVPLKQLCHQVAEVLNTCNFEIIYGTDNYLMARESRDGLPFTTLVIVEVLVDITRATQEAKRLNIVVKNEELPLRSNNHCYQVYQHLSQVIEDHKTWSLIGSAKAGRSNKTNAHPK